LLSQRGYNQANNRDGVCGQPQRGPSDVYLEQGKRSAHQRVHLLCAKATDKTIALQLRAE